MSLRGIKWLSQLRATSFIWFGFVFITLYPAICSALGRTIQA